MVSGSSVSVMTIPLLLGISLNNLNDFLKKEPVRGFIKVPFAGIKTYGPKVVIKLCEV